jgi:heme/copper-type cytochrome/quinol oxidase subunit 4
MPFKRVPVWWGIGLLGVGLVFQLLAAGATKGGFAAYRNHVVGFVLLTLVTVVAMVFVGRRYWRGRVDLWLFTLGALQAVVGALTWVIRFHV